jgi:isovaleryl-CoA dehydrogenase
MSLNSLNFNLGADIEALRDAINRFAQHEIAPMAVQVDELNEFPATLWPKLGKDGAIKGMTWLRDK